MEQNTSNEIYHERQVKELCALHALNNLFQDKRAFTKKDLDEICLKLSPDCFINPHRSLLGFGNYDVNVLMAAIQVKECETIWFDKRKDIRCLVPDNIFGFILNTPSSYKWGFFHLPFRRKHWISFRKVGNAYYNLDSKLDAPELIGDDKLLLDYLHHELEDGDKELLLVVHTDVASTGAWKQDIGVPVNKTSEYGEPVNKTSENGQLTNTVIGKQSPIKHSNGEGPTTSQLQSTNDL